MNCNTRVIRVGIQGPPGIPGESAGLGSNRQVLTYSPSNSYNLNGQPTDPAKTLFFVNGAKQIYGADYTINSTVLSWVSPSLQLAVNDTIEIYY